MLQKMCFIEKGVDRIRLTAHMIMHTKLTIKQESKAMHMRQISSYYIKILEEFFLVNSGEQGHIDEDIKSINSASF